jgi:hypothetical protein
MLRKLGRNWVLLLFGRGRELREMANATLKIIEERGERRRSFLKE